VEHDRPATDREVEIEVTPEMIEAGIFALQEFNVNEDDLEWVVCGVYEAMTLKKSCRLTGE
jgi:hypothetical protein